MATTCSDTPAGTAARDFHPMEAIPWFRRFAPSPLRNVIYTFLFNAILGTFFWLMAIADSPGNRSLLAWSMTLVVANVIGYTIHVLFGLGSYAGLDRKLRNHPVLVTVYYTGVSLAGSIIGFGIVASVLHVGLPKFLFSPEWIAMMAAVSLTISGVLSLIFFSRARSARAEAALQGERLRAERIEREAALANVTSLIDPDPAAAKRMLESFIRFLRASLASTRTRETTLGQERSLIAAYLDILQIRMGPRLRYRIDVPPELDAFALPPMLLQPIVENAIVHGLEPKIEGGEIEVSASRAGDDVAIEIADTGVGFGAATRGGVGLTNLRERLEALYGGRARLEIVENEPAGTRVRVRIPA